MAHWVLAVFIINNKKKFNGLKVACRCKNKKSRSNLVLRHISCTKTILSIKRNNIDNKVTTIRCYVQTQNQFPFVFTSGRHKIRFTANDWRIYRFDGCKFNEFTCAITIKPQDNFLSTMTLCRSKEKQAKIDLTGCNEIKSVTVWIANAVKSKFTIACNFLIKIDLLFASLRKTTSSAASIGSITWIWSTIFFIQFSSLLDSQLSHFSFVSSNWTNRQEKETEVIKLKSENHSLTLTIFSSYIFLLPFHSLLQSECDFANANALCVWSWHSRSWLHVFFRFSVCEEKKKKKQKYFLFTHFLHLRRVWHFQFGVWRKISGDDKREEQKINIFTIFISELVSVFLLFWYIKCGKPVRLRCCRWHYHNTVVGHTFTWPRQKDSGKIGRNVHAFVRSIQSNSETVLLPKYPNYLLHFWFMFASFCSATCDWQWREYWWDDVCRNVDMNVELMTHFFLFHSQQSVKVNDCEHAQTHNSEREKKRKE